MNEPKAVNTPQPAPVSPLDPSAPIVTVCAWCPDAKEIMEKNPGVRFSHDICRACKAESLRKHERGQYEERLANAARMIEDLSREAGDAQAREVTALGLQAEAEREAARLKAELANAGGTLGRALRELDGANQARALANLKATEAENQLEGLRAAIRKATTLRVKPDKKTCLHLEAVRGRIVFPTPHVGDDGRTTHWPGGFEFGEDGCVETCSRCWALRWVLNGRPSKLWHATVDSLLQSKA